MECFLLGSSISSITDNMIVCIALVQKEVYRCQMLDGANESIQDSRIGWVGRKLEKCWGIIIITVMSTIALNYHTEFSCYQLCQLK